MSPSSTAASGALFDRARAVTPGGVNSPVRAFNAVGGTPRFIRSAQGAWLTDVDGNEYVDLICSWGPMLLGPRPPRGPGRGQRRGRPRHVVRRPDGARGRARRGDRRPRAGGAGPVRLLRHRGHHVGDPAGPRLHRPRRGREVRRLLPRSRRLAARLRGLRARHLRGARHARRARVVDRAHAGAALQRPGRRREGLRRARRPDRLPGHRGRPGQHGRRPARARLQRVPRRDLPPPRRAVRQRRGDDRLPGLAARASGASTAPSRAGCPTWSRSAR